MSLEEMAERSGVSLSSLKRFENTGKISLDSLLKLMHLIGRLNDIVQLGSLLVEKLIELLYFGFPTLLRLGYRNEPK